jgi:hypothetical protein
MSDNDNAPGETAPELTISDGAVAEAGRRRRTNPADIMAIPKPAPGVVPEGSTPSLAMDSQIDANSEWAQTGLIYAYEEGLTFLGYPYLAALAQRPEYRRLSEIMSTEMTREWIELRNDGEEDKSDELAQLEDAMDRLEVRDVFRRIAEQDGFFGRGHLYIDLGTTDDPEELKTSIGDGRDRMSLAKIAKGGLKALRPVEAVWCYPNNYNSTDPLSANWYKPETWFVMGKEIHQSRLLMFVGRELPDILKPVYAFGGLSMSQMAKPYIDNWLRTRDAVSALIHSFSTSGVKTNMAVTLQRDGEHKLFNRADFYNRMRDMRGLMLLDKETEEFFNVSTPLGGLSDLQAQAQEQICSVSGLPLIKYTGLTPTGLNASSEGEIRSFYDWVAAMQELLFRKNLERVLDFIQLSEFGRIDPDLTFVFRPLWQLDDAGMAAVQKTKADTHAVYEQMGTVSNLEIREVLSADPEGPYAAIDLPPDQLPEPPLPPTEATTPFSGSEARIGEGALPGRPASPASSASPAGSANGGRAPDRYTDRLIRRPNGP